MTKKEKIKQAYMLKGIVSSEFHDKLDCEGFMHSQWNTTENCGLKDEDVDRLEFVDVWRIKELRSLYVKTGIELIFEERQFQLSKHTVSEDADHYPSGELTRAATALGLYSEVVAPSTVSAPDWAWRLREKTPDRIKQLQIAGAFIAAEIDRLNYLKHHV